MMGGVARSHHVVVVACRGADCLVCARKNASGLDLLSEACARERKRVREDSPSEEEVKRCKSRTESVCAERCDEWLQTELGFTQLAIRYARNAFKRGERVIAMHYEDRRKAAARPVLCKNDKGHFYILVVLRDANEPSLRTRPWRSARVAALNCGPAAKCLREMHEWLAAALAENEGALERVVAELQSGGF
jgi:hypothetical protein